MTMIWLNANTIERRWPHGGKRIPKSHGQASRNIAKPIEKRFLKSIASGARNFHSDPDWLVSDGVKITLRRYAAIEIAGIEKIERRSPKCGAKSIYRNATKFCVHKEPRGSCLRRSSLTSSGENASTVDSIILLHWISTIQIKTRNAASANCIQHIHGTD